MDIEYNASMFLCSQAPEISYNMSMSLLVKYMLCKYNAVNIF